MAEARLVIEVLNFEAKHDDSPLLGTCSISINKALVSKGWKAVIDRDGRPQVYPPQFKKRNGTWGDLFEFPRIYAKGRIEEAILEKCVQESLISAADAYNGEE